MKHTVNGFQWKCYEFKWCFEGTIHSHLAIQSFSSIELLCGCWWQQLNRTKRNKTPVCCEGEHRVDDDHHLHISNGINKEWFWNGTMPNQKLRSPRLMFLSRIYSKFSCISDQCLPSYFRCNDGKCIPMSWKCDSKFDCNDNSDESPTECSTSKSCLDTQFECEITQRCIPKLWVCDGDYDCGSMDTSDEESPQCPSTIKCQPNQDQCSDGQCIDTEKFCDGKFDCVNDEYQEHCRKF